MRNKIFKLLTLGLCMFSFTAVAQNTDTISLDLATALKIAHDNNPTIKIADIEIQRIDYSKKEAIGNLLPQLSASGQYTDNIKKSVMFMPESFSAMMGGAKYMEIGYKNSFTGTLSAALPLVNFSLWETLKNKQADIDLVLEKSRASKIDMTKQVKDAYFACLLAKASLDVLTKSIGNAKETLKSTENAYNNGAVSEYDYIRAQVQVNNLNPSFISAKNGLQLAILQLKMLLSLPAEQGVKIAETLEDYSKEPLTYDSNRNLTTNSDLRQLDLNIQKTENSLKLIKTQHMPSLSAFGQYVYQTQAEDFKIADYNWVGSAAIGLSLSIPIFKGNTIINQQKQTELAIKEMRLQRDYTSDALKLQIQSAINSMEAAKEQLVANKDAIAQAERGYDIAKVRYQTGTGTILELNDSELSLTQSKLNYQQSFYNYLTAKTNLDKILGKE